MRRQPQHQQKSVVKIINLIKLFESSSNILDWINSKGLQQ